MTGALELARRGEGHVEPNPMVGCVIVLDGQIVGQGWHRRYGGPHAEIEALSEAGRAARGATLYVTLEPCSHYGKTPPCVDAIHSAGLRRVVVAQRDPNPKVSGGGILRLRAEGIQVEEGLLEVETRRLNASYLKLVLTGLPWLIAKWAMTLDGKIATRGGDSKWISCQRSREIVHCLRGRVDAILIGLGTASADDPLLTARPGGARTATRVVLDTTASLSLNSQLVRTAKQIPLLVAAGNEAPAENRRALSALGCEVYVCQGQTRTERFGELLLELGRRQMTNGLVEGGGELLGTALEAEAIDEVHAFIAPKLIGGAAAKSPVEGAGIQQIIDAVTLDTLSVEQLDGDVYIHGRVERRDLLE